MALLMNISAILTMISIVILIILLSIYFNNLRKIKSKFTIGLLLFALLFLIEKLISIYFYITMMDFYSPQVTPHVFTISIIQSIALLILLKITWE